MRAKEPLFAPFRISRRRASHHPLSFGFLDELIDMKRTSSAVKEISVSDSDKDLISVGIVPGSFTSCVLCDGSAAIALNLATISFADMIYHLSTHPSVSTSYHG